MTVAAVQSLPRFHARPSWRKHWYSLHFKASFLVALLVLFVIVFGTALGLRAMSAVLYENEYVRTLHWANSLATNASEPFSTGDQAALLDSVNKLAAMSGVAYAAFANEDCQLIASAEAKPGLVKALLSPDGKRLLMRGLNRPKVMHNKSSALTYVDVIAPVRGGRAGQTLGYLRFGTDISSTKAKLEQIAQRVTRTAMCLLILVVPASVLATRRVVAPLRELAHTAHAIANGSMDARAKIRSGDEIGELAESFNRMANRLTESQMELLELNAELEQRVQQRTRQLEELAARDPLTGLYNRRYFGEVMTREFAGAERYGDDLTCLMFDLDHFKMINDRLGHRTGDAILIALARAIAGELRGSDVAARFGGDEFIVLMPQTSASAASNLAERVVRSFTREAAQSAPGIGATVSIGVASLHMTRAPSSEALIHEADVALYAAKEGGRNRTMEAAAVCQA